MVAARSSEEKWEALREDVLQNAVNFLLHPRVKGSPIMQQRSFLVEKGLTNVEIEEAFRRVLDPSSNASSNTVATREGSTLIQQPMAQLVPSNSLPVVQTHSRPYWSQMAWAVSFLLAACTGTGFLFKRLLLQKLKLWIRRVVLEDDVGFVFSQKKLDEEVTMAAMVAVKSASTAAAEVASASQEMIKMHAEEKHYVSNIIQALEAHTLELTKAMTMMEGIMEARPKQLTSTKAQSIEKQYTIEDKSLEHIQTPQKLSISNVNLIETSINRDKDKCLEVPQSSRPDRAPHSASYLEVMAMLERGETPPGIQEINDKPPNPHQLPSVSCLHPKPKPWETARANSDNKILKLMTYNSSANAENHLKSAHTGNGLNQVNGPSCVQHLPSLPTSSSEGKGVVTASVNAVPWGRQRKAEQEQYSLPSFSENTVKTTEDAESAATGPLVTCSGSQDENGIHDDGHKRSTYLVSPLNVIPGVATTMKYCEGLQGEKIASSSLRESSLVPSSSGMPFNSEDVPGLVTANELKHTRRTALQSLLHSEGEDKGLEEITTFEVPSCVPDPVKFCEKGMQDDSKSSLVFSEVPEFEKFSLPVFPQGAQISSLTTGSDCVSTSVAESYQHLELKDKECEEPVETPFPDVVEMINVHRLEAQPLFNPQDSLQSSLSTTSMSANSQAMQNFFPTNEAVESKLDLVSESLEQECQRPLEQMKNMLSDEHQSGPSEIKEPEG